MVRRAMRQVCEAVATGAVLYHDPGRRPLQDVLSCVREGCTIDQAGLKLQANAERFLKPPAEMARAICLIIRSQPMVETHQQKYSSTHLVQTRIRARP